MAITKQQFEKLSRHRLNEAIYLFDGGHHSGAYYLSGYAIELALKACIAASFQPGAIPDKRFVERIYTHSIQALVGLAELEADRRELADRDAVFAQNWEYVAAWSESARYRLVEEDEARFLIEAVRDPQHGVHRWIAAHW